MLYRNRELYCQTRNPAWEFESCDETGYEWGLSYQDYIYECYGIYGEQQAYRHLVCFMKSVTFFDSYSRAYSKVLSKALGHPDCPTYLLSEWSVISFINWCTLKIDSWECHYNGHYNNILDVEIFELFESCHCVWDKQLFTPSHFVVLPNYHFNFMVHGLYCSTGYLWVLYISQ